MTFILEHNTTKEITIAPTPLHATMRDHHDLIADAAVTLGGRKGSRLMVQLQSALRNNKSMNRVLLRAAHRLLQVLKLEHTHDLEREEAALAAAIHPADPVVCDLCRAADLLEDAILASIAAIAPHPAARAA